MGVQYSSTIGTPTQTLSWSSVLCLTVFRDKYVYISWLRVQLNLYVSVWVRCRSPPVCLDSNRLVRPARTLDWVRLRARVRVRLASAPLQIQPSSYRSTKPRPSRSSPPTLSLAVESVFFSFRVSSADGLGSFRIVAGGTGCDNFDTDLSGLVAVPNTGGKNRYTDIAV